MNPNFDGSTFPSLGHGQFNGGSAVAEPGRELYIVRGRTAGISGFLAAPRSKCRGRERAEIRNLIQPCEALLAAPIKSDFDSRFCFLPRDFGGLRVLGRFDLAGAANDHPADWPTTRGADPFHNRFGVG